MGGRGASSGGGGGGGGGANSMNILGGTAQAATVAQAVANNNAVFSDTDNSPYHDLYNGRQYFQNQNLTIDQQLAISSYLSDTPENGSLFSFSQNLNTALANDQKLSVSQQYVYDNMMDSMHNLGYNLNLTRYDHETMVNGLLKKAGLSKSYENYTEKQLKSALVGTEYTEHRLVSTSYNDFAAVPSSKSDTFTTRAVKVKYQAKASTKAVMPGNGPGGAFGEMVMAPDQKMKIVDISFNGKSARKQGGSKYNLNQRQVEIVVEVG